MAKNKKEKPVLNLDGKDYIIEDMTDKQRELAGVVATDQNHVNDIQNKLATNSFTRQQLEAVLEVFSKRHQDGVLALKDALEPEITEAEVA